MLRPCAACARHVEVGELSCRWCGARLATAESRDPIAYVGRLSRAAIFAGAVVAAPLGCGPSVRYEPLVADGSAFTTGAVKGQVLRHDGEPLSNASITLYSEQLRTNADGRDSISTQLNAKGEFRVENLPPGDYRLGLSALSGSPRFTVRLGQVTVLSIELDKPKRDPRPMAKPYGAPPARRRIV